MPYSYNTFNEEISHLIHNLFDSDDEVLDVGAGAGKYAALLTDFPYLSAIEIHGPNIDKFKLNERYHEVFHTDARGFDAYGEYDLVIMGDVLEHMTPAEAREILRQCNSALVIVPYEYAQGAVDGNAHEEHLQPDLTEEVMAERYPELTFLFGDRRMGVYMKSSKEIINKALNMAPSSESSSNDDDEYPCPTDEELASSPLHTAPIPSKPLIVTPTVHGLNDIEYTRSIYKSVGMLQTRYGTNHSLVMMDGSTVHKSRNRAVALFMDSDYDVLVFIDSDQGWEPVVLDRLLNARRPVVGAPVRKKTSVLSWNINTFTRPVATRGGFIQIKTIGTGILAIHRHVFELLMNNYKHLQIRHSGVTPPPSYQPYYYNLFQHSMDADQIEHSEDISFCLRWGAIGGSVWADYEAETTHVGRAEFRGSLKGHVKTVVSESELG